MAQFPSEAKTLEDRVNALIAAIQILQPEFDVHLVKKTVGLGRKQSSRSPPKTVHILKGTVPPQNMNSQIVFFYSRGRAIETDGASVLKPPLVTTHPLYNRIALR